MKELNKWGLMLLIVSLMAGLGSYSMAAYQIEVSDDKGSYMDNFTVSPSSVAGTAVWSASQKRMDSLIFNNTSTTIWLGEVSATQDNQTHDNITGGIPLLSSATLTLDGRWTGGDIYATCDQEVASCELRVMELLHR